MSVRIVSRELLQPNGWNPNVVLSDNIQLLIRSIQVNGWTLPIVCKSPDDNGLYTIIDGYHRWLVSGIEPLFTQLGGMVPVVVVNHADKAKDIYGTITHNRARGTHQLGPMKAIVKQLLEAGKTVDEIGRELGMKNEEVFRLSDFSREDFLQLMARSIRGYSPAKLIKKV
jgi:ParB-like chromosome segregation protein Spo0J